MEVISLTRKNYYSLDIAKFCCALTIISAHFASEWGHFITLVDYIFSIYIIAVPFFFTCSGFLFCEKFFALYNHQEKKRFFIKYLQHIFTMYLWWSLIYFLFVVIEWIKSGTNLIEVVQYFHTALVFTTYPTIWFLPALGIAIALFYTLQKRFSIKSILILGFFLYVIGSLGYSYSFVQEKVPALGKVYDIYGIVFKTSRNGLFNGLPFVAIGAFISIHKANFRLYRLHYGVLSFVAMIAVVCEAFILKIAFSNIGADTVFFLLPFEFFLLQFLLTINLRKNKLYLWMRQQSTLIFVSQRLFLTALPGVLPKVVTDIAYKNSFVGLVIIIGITILFSSILIKAENKYSWLKALH